MVNFSFRKTTEIVTEKICATRWNCVEMHAASQRVRNLTEIAYFYREQPPPRRKDSFHRY